MGEQPMIELDVNDITTDIETVDTETTTPEASTEETKPEVVAEADTAELTDTEDKEEEAAEPEPQVDETDDLPKRAVERKEQLQSEIRQLVSQKNELRNEIASRNAQVYRPQSADDLIAEGVDPAIARVEALEQRTQMAEYNAHVTDLNANLNVESLQVLADFPVYDPNSPQYDAGFANRVASIYQRSAGIQTDPQTGLVMSATVLPYETYKAFAETYSSGAQKGQVSGQKAAEKMLAAADTPSSSIPQSHAKEDPFLTGFMSNMNK